MYGQRGQICERFGWTYKYLLTEIPWLDVHLMMVDAYFYIPPKVDEKGNVIKDKNKKKQPPSLENFLNQFKQ